MTEVRVNEEFKALLDPLDADERKTLEEELVHDGGPRDPIIVWKDHGDIVDGHNRYDICRANDLPFKTHEKVFADVEAVKQWMITNQLARRNLSPQRASYFRGVLYNMQKQTDQTREASPDGKTTAERIGDKFGVSEHTVRREGDVAKGIDTVAKVKNITNVRERLAQIAGRNDTSFSKEELGAIGRVADPEKAAEVVQHVETAKAAGMRGPEVVKAALRVTGAAKNKPAAEAPAAAPKKEQYGVAFAAPTFDMSFSPSNEAKPPLLDNAVLYLAVPDEGLTMGLELMKRWGLKYECSFLFPIAGYEGIWSDIRHQFLLVGTRGDVIGPKKLHHSITTQKSDDPEGLMIKMIETFHPQAKRLDMRKKNPAQGWATLPKVA